MTNLSTGSCTTLVRKIAVLLLLCICTAANAVDIRHEINDLFPKATRIDEKLDTLPVYPVFQLNELIGYAWISTDINDIPGFAGKPIKLLIGLNPDGVFQNVVVLDHHEPVFLHGLGNEALDEFVAQYSGNAISDQIIVSSGQNRQSGNNTSGPIYFDGVTKATVSVIIVNDVVLSTALKVARKTLEGFALPAQSALLKKDFKEMDWNQLMQSGLIHRWTIPVDDIEQQLGHKLADYPDTFLDEPAASDVFTDLHYAYLNAEDVGRNLLGEEIWRDLMGGLKPDEHLIWVGSNGLYPHVSETFTPGTVPSRLSIEQSGLSIELRDTNMPEVQARTKTDETLNFRHQHILRIKGSSGFDLGSELSLKLNINLQRNHLISDTLLLSSAYQLPQSHWVKQEVEDPLTSSQALWLRIWADKVPQIAALLAALALLLYVFINQRKFSAYTREFHYFRWAYLWFTLLYIGFYAQGQLSVVNIFTLLHSIRDGFDLGIFLLDPVIFILWIVTFISLFVWGRGLFCGWLCPFGAMQEILSAAGKYLNIRQLKISEKTHRKLIVIKYPILIGLVVLSFYSLTWAERLAEVEPFKTSITLVFIRYWPFVFYAVALLAIGLFIHKFYCRYICPLGAGLAILGYFHRYEWLERIDLCGSPCQTCTNRCEIDAIRKNGDIDYNECIQCLECIVILNNEDLCVDKLLNKKKNIIPIVAV